MAEDVNLKLLRTFEAVARNGSFTRAAGELRRSQATVSSQVSVLERQLAVQLIERTSRSVALTIAGQELYDALGHAFRLIDNGLEKARDQSAVRRGRVVVACVTSLSNMVLPRILASYRAKDAATRIDVEELTSTEMVALLSAEPIDFGIGPCIEPPPQGIAFAAILDDPLFVLLPAGRSAAPASGVGFATLATLPLITLSGSVLLQRQLDETAKSLGIRLHSQSEVRHVHTAIAMVQAGVGAAIVPRLALPLELGSGLIARPIVDPVMIRRIGILTRRGAALRPPAARLARFIRAELARMATTGMVP